MASANLDLARSIFADRERGDYRSVDWAHPEIEYVIVDGPSPGAWSGPAGMAKGIREIVSSWEGYRTRADAFRELDDERVLVLTSRSGGGRTSGVQLDELQTRGASLIQVRDGRVTKIVNWFDRDRALADLGLAPGGRLAVTTSPNLQLVRSILADWERGDYSSAEWADPEIEYVIADGPSPGRWTGLAGMAEGARANLDAWEHFRFKADEYRELDRERVLVLHDYSGRGKTSGLEMGRIRSKGANLFHVREGKVTKLVHYWERERALDDLGLAPERNSP